MSGYAKRLMEIAPRWWAANPDPGDPRLHLPDRIVAGTGMSVKEARKRYDLCMTTSPRLDDAEFVEVARKAEDALRHLEEKDRQVAGTINRLLQPCQVGIDIVANHERDDGLASAIIGHFLVCWARDGYNVFDLSPDFVAAMLLTDPAGLNLENLRLPFGGMLVLIPDRFVPDRQGGSFTKIHVCEIMQAATADQDGEPVLLSESIGRLIDIRGNSATRWLVSTIKPDDLTEHGVAALCDYPTAWVDDEPDQASMEAVQRIVLGMLAYVSSVDRPMERKEPGGKRHKAGGPALTHWEVARTVKIDPRLVQAARSGSREISFRLKHRHIVRGHYRNQPHGTGRRERKHIWITPFWRGPEDGAQIVHTYKPTDPDAPAVVGLSPTKEIDRGGT